VYEDYRRRVISWKVISPLKMEATSTFETLLPIYEIICYNIPENNYVYNFRTYTAQMFSYVSFNASVPMWNKQISRVKT